MDWGEIILITGNLQYQVLFLLSGVLLYYWLRPFVRAKRAAAAATFAYTLISMLLTFYVDTPQKGIAYVLLKYAAVASGFALLCLLDRRNFRQKLFLMIVFVFLKWLAQGIFSDLGFYERDWFMALPLFRESISAMVIEFFSWQLIYALGCPALLYFAFRSLKKAYRAKEEEVSWQELIMLLSPVAAMLTVRELVSQYYRLWNQGVENGSIQANIPGSPYRLLFYICSFAATLSLIYFYQQVKNQQREQGRQELLLRQVEENRRSIETVQGLYHEMSALKHDMGNHIAVLEHAISQNRLDEATQYSEALKSKLAETRPLLVTGNAITDILLSEAARKCAENGIAFASAFRFPSESGIDVFDLSIVLSNALDNAIEAQEAVDEPEIEISSSAKGGTFLICVKNTVAEPLKLSKGELPTTGKKEAGHGYGLENIQKIAQKYGGDLDLRQQEREQKCYFCLDIMLQL